MRTKVVWLFLWMTLAMWVGCAGEQATERMADAGALEQQAEPTGESLADGDDTEADAGPARRLDRGDWSRTVIVPERGRVAHWPTYYNRRLGEREIRYIEDRPSPLRQDGSVEDQAEAVMRSDVALYTRSQVTDGVAGLLKFGFDTVALPVRMIQTPPWQVQYTPER